MKATVFATGSIGNVGPGFDVLGLAVDGLGDRVTVELSSGPEVPVRVHGIDAAKIPTDPARNGSSPRVSASRPHFGVRTMFTVGARLAPIIVLIRRCCWPHATGLSPGWLPAFGSTTISLPWL